MKLTFVRTELFAFILTSGILFAGCKKTKVDKFNPTDCSQCLIQEIVVERPDQDSLHYIFTYNTNGDPVTVKNDGVTTGNPNLFFVYDQNHRLTQMVHPYENGFYESWDKYGYNSTGQIVRDTMYQNGLFTDSIAQPAVAFTAYFTYSYDAQGRISKRTDSTFYYNVYSNTDSATFSYDATGNQIRLGVTYDNKNSILRTNKVWMFICNDFSVNNPFTATAYNSYKLPFDFPAVDYNNYLAPIIPQQFGGRVVYACP